MATITVSTLDATRDSAEEALFRKYLNHTTLPDGRVLVVTDYEYAAGKTFKAISQLSADGSLGHTGGCGTDVSALPDGRSIVVDSMVHTVAVLGRDLAKTAVVVAGQAETAGHLYEDEPLPRRCAAASCSSPAAAPSCPTGACWSRTARTTRSGC
jgi:hypothetical protein